MVHTCCLSRLGCHAVRSEQLYAGSLHAWEEDCTVHITAIGMEHEGQSRTKDRDETVSRVPQ